MSPLTGTLGLSPVVKTRREHPHVPLCPRGIPLGRLKLWGPWVTERVKGALPAAVAPDARLLPGNLLSSLMGSSEQEGEDSQDDSSPIELD